MSRMILFVFLTLMITMSHTPAFSDSQSTQIIPRKFDVPTASELNRMSPNYFNNTIESTTEEKFLFDVIPSLDNKGKIISYTVKPDPKFTSLYKQVGFTSASKRTVYIYPIFTQAAYSDGGFYDYYKKQCDSHCLTVSVPATVASSFSSSRSADLVLSILNYSRITDVDVDKNPDILKKYKKVIVLHNEYITKKEFDAITNHPNVVYLYPNALYAEVKTDYRNNTISLVKGHGYPDASISNGFGWKYDNSQYEYDTKCDNWKFVKIPQGKMLNCYPSSQILKDQSLLQAIRHKNFIKY